MRVFCNVGEIRCEVEFVEMTNEIRWVGSFVKGRYGAMETYRTVKPTAPLYAQAAEAARAKRVSDQLSG